METNDRLSGQQGLDRNAGETTEQAGLKRAAHKIAWSRMNGRNDAVNPFAEAQHAAPANGRDPSA